MLQNRHSMAPLRREHEEVRRLVADLTRLVDGPGRGQAAASARSSRSAGSIYPLYALLEVHLVEEELYVPIVDHAMSEEAAAVMAAALDHSGIPKT